MDFTSTHEQQALGRAPRTPAPGDHPTALCGIRTTLEELAFGSPASGAFAVAFSCPLPWGQPPFAVDFLSAYQRFSWRAGFDFSAVAWNAAHRFFVAAEIAFLPAELILRFGIVVTASASDSDRPLDSAHRFRCASPIRFRAAALIFRRLPFDISGVAAGSMRPSSMARSSAI